jgi:hypothetical protein
MSNVRCDLNCPRQKLLAEQEALAKGIAEKGGIRGKRRADLREGVAFDSD